MVGVAQLVEHGIVTPVVEGSIPFVHPIFRKSARSVIWRFFCVRNFPLAVQVSLTPRKSKHSQCLGVRIVAGFERVELIQGYIRVGTAI